MTCFLMLFARKYQMEHDRKCTKSSGLSRKALDDFSSQSILEFHVVGQWPKTSTVLNLKMQACCIARLGHRCTTLGFCPCSVPILSCRKQKAGPPVSVPEFSAWSSGPFMPSGPDRWEGPPNVTNQIIGHTDTHSWTCGRVQHWIYHIAYHFNFKPTVNKMGFNWESSVGAMMDAAAVELTWGQITEAKLLWHAAPIETIETQQTFCWCYFRSLFQFYLGVSIMGVSKMDGLQWKIPI